MSLPPMPNPSGRRAARTPPNSTGRGNGLPPRRDPQARPSISARPGLPAPGIRRPAPAPALPTRRNPEPQQVEYTIDPEELLEVEETEDDAQSFYNDEQNYGAFTQQEEQPEDEYYAPQNEAEYAYEEEVEEDDSDEVIPLPSNAGTAYRNTPLAPKSQQPGNYQPTEMPLHEPFTEEVQESISLLLSALSEESSEILMNGPDDILYTIDGARYNIPDIDFKDTETYHKVINEIILPLTDTSERIGKNTYLVEGQLEYDDGIDDSPIMARVHIVAPPVVKNAVVTIAKKSRKAFSVVDLAERGTMSWGMAQFLIATAQSRVNTVFSGLSGAGKTTLLEALTYHFDANDRVIVVEDTKELRLPLSDTVYMTTTSSKPGVSKEDVVSMEWLVKATNRMRPTRIIVGEVRGGEMAEFLIAANSGADGSLTTLHAADPKRTLDKMTSLAMKAEGSKSEITVRRDIASTVQLIVQATLIDGQHIISHIEEISRSVHQQTGAIATQTLFAYDRDSGEFVSPSRPSEEFRAYMAQRGVNVDMEWFK